MQPEKIRYQRQIIIHLEILTQWPSSNYQLNTHVALASFGNIATITGGQVLVELAITTECGGGPAKLHLVKYTPRYIIAIEAIDNIVSKAF